MDNLRIEPDTSYAIDHLDFRPVSPKYKLVQFANAAIAYTVLAALALCLLFTGFVWWCIAAEIVIVISFIVNIIILSKAYLHKGYAIRQHDITYRSGVIFPKITTVTFAKIQQVSISQNPVTKFFGLSAVEVVNGAQGLSSIVIQGLPSKEAEQIKNLLTQRINRDYD